MKNFTKDDLKAVGGKAVSILCVSVAAVGAVRFCEALFSTYYTGEFLKHATSNLKGFFFDACYLLILSAVVMPVSFAIKKGRTKFNGFRWIVCVLLTVSMFLVVFFAQSGFPLDRLIFVYSLDEIIETLTSSNSTTWWIYVCIALVPCAYLWASRKSFAPTRTVCLSLAAVLLASIAVRLCKYDSSVKNRNYTEECNKLCYFVRSSATMIGGGKTDNELDIEKVHKLWAMLPDHEFVSERTPFLHKSNELNTLAPFLNLGERKPNLVFVCVEGLGRENSGRNSKYASATPFLDSLAEQSLSWENCLSTSQRTVSALPSILGALPFSTYGFMAMKAEAPEFHSLPRILEKNGYRFSFYYGGWGDFDDMGTFIALNNGEQYFEKKFGNDVPRNEWGLHDKFLFDEAVKRIDFENPSPRIDFYLTLTSHKPWDYPDKQHYVELYRQECQKQGKPQNPEYEAAASYIYVDEAIRLLIERYREHKGFDNTIFIITGDHNFNDNTFILERYHVPLIIWSPMLTERRDIKALASHRDITPTLLAMLGCKYDIATPQNVAWLNTGLDTTTTFRSRLFSPQIDLSRELKLLVYNNFYVYGDEVYQFTFDNEMLNIESVTDEAVCDSLRTMQRTYRELDYFVCKNDALINKYTVKSHKQVADIRLSNATDSTIPKGEFTNLIDLPLSKNLNTLNINFKCSRKATMGSELALVFEIRDKNGINIYYDSCRIPVFEGFNWSGWDSENKIDAAKYYGEGTVLKAYIWNKDSKECYITDIQLVIDNTY